MLGNLNGLMAFGMSGLVERVLMCGRLLLTKLYTTIDVEEDPETKTGLLRIHYEKVAGEPDKYIELLVDFSSEDTSVTLTHFFRNKFLFEPHWFTESEGWLVVSFVL